MTADNIIQGNNTEEIINQIESQFTANPELLIYNATLNQGNTAVYLAIEVDPGGGFEGGFETTSLRAPIPENDGFRFAIHPEGFFQEIGKFFGMQDLITGYPEFDESVIVKSNDEGKVKTLFEDEEVRRTFGSLEGFALGIHSYSYDDEAKKPFLEFETERAIFDTEELKKIYSSYIKVLEALSV